MCLYVKGEAGISWSVLGKRGHLVWPAILSYILRHKKTVQESPWQSCVGEYTQYAQLVLKLMYMHVLHQSSYILTSGNLFSGNYETQ